MSEVDQSGVAKTFEDSCVLITGATGFLGKVLVEKLLYSLPKIKTIFLLIRSAKGESPGDRLDRILQSPLFNRVRCYNEELLKKLVPISSDLTKANLDLSETDSQLLCDNVSIVFHCAATVKFDEVLKASIQMNVIGTQRLIDLCKKMKHLKSIVHTSTAYANCNLTTIEEKVYKITNVNVAKLVDGASWMSDEMFDLLTQTLLDGRPNTYTFTKAMAEHQLLEDVHQLPLIIFRPSIIGAIWREPLPGWMDNLNGASGIFAGVGKGFMTNMQGNITSKADIIPVDIVSNMMIVLASYRANLNSVEIPVMHCTSGGLNPVKWERVVNYLEQFYMQYPLDECYRVPSTKLHYKKSMFLLTFYMKHYIPAYIIDKIFLFWRKPKLLRIYDKVWRITQTLHHFTTHNWNFEYKNMLSLWNSLSDEDKRLFNFDVRKVNWDKYLFDYVMGVKLYLLKEKLENLPVARSNLAWLHKINLYLNAGVWALFVRVFAWRRPQKQKWTVWMAGFVATFLAQNFGGYFRPKVYLRSLEEYKREALPHYADFKREDI